MKKLNFRIFRVFRLSRRELATASGRVSWEKIRRNYEKKDMFII